MDLFDSNSLDKSFSRALAVEHKVDPFLLSPQLHCENSSAPSSPQSPTSSKDAKLCTFHKSSFHNTIDWYVLCQNSFCLFS